MSLGLHVYRIGCKVKLCAAWRRHSCHVVGIGCYNAGR